MEKLIAYHDGAGSPRGIPGLKHAMDLNGYYGGPVRLPLVPVSPAANNEIEVASEDLR